MLLVLYFYTEYFSRFFAAKPRIFLRIPINFPIFLIFPATSSEENVFPISPSRLSLEMLRPHNSHLLLFGHHHVVSDHQPPVKTNTGNARTSLPTSRLVLLELPLKPRVTCVVTCHLQRCLRLHPNRLHDALVLSVSRRVLALSHTYTTSIQDGCTHGVRTRTTDA